MSFWVMTAVTLCLAALLARWALIAARSRTWPTVDGVITRTAVDVDDGTHLLRVEYRYTVGATSHDGDRVRFGGVPGVIRQKSADALVARFPVGSHVAVHVDPTDPRRAVLEPGAGAPFWVGFAILAMAEIVAIAAR